MAGEKVGDNKGGGGEEWSNGTGLEATVEEEEEEEEEETFVLIFLARVLVVE